MKMMYKLSDRKWEAIPIIEIFDRLEAGKGKGLNHLIQVKQGIPYIGATNRNNGVMCYVEDNEISHKMIQDGNCIGFIKNGDGSAGYAIYKHESFISTSDVIYGYADWLNLYTGLFFVAAQDMIEEKYSHGYKRNRQHLRGDKVMLPITSAGKPDYKFMEDYVKNLKKEKIDTYFKYLNKNATKIEYKDIPAINDKKWKDFFLIDIFPKIKRGKRLKNEDHIAGSIPYVSSSSLNNGIDDFVGNELKVRKYKNCLSLANSGSVGSCFYEPFEFIASDHVTHLQNDNFSMYTYLFIATMARRLSEKYNFNREISDTRIRREKILLPITDDGAPDYEYMDQFMKNLMIAKYKQYFECYK